MGLSFLAYHRYFIQHFPHITTMGQEFDQKENI